MIALQDCPSKKTPTPDDYRLKAERHKELLLAIFRAKAKARDFPEAVKEITQLIVEGLSTEYMSVFFESKERNTLNRWAFALSRSWKARSSSGTRDFTFDEVYRRDGSTLMWPAHDGPYAQGLRSTDRPYSSRLVDFVKGRHL